MMRIRSGAASRMRIGWMTATAALVLANAAISITSGTAALAASPKNESPRDMKFPDLEFDPPKPERIVLSNGMAVWFLRDPELPLVSASAVIRTGSVLDPDGKWGLSGMTMQLLRNGGTERASSEALNDTLEYLAASIETSSGDDAGNASLSVLSKDVDTGLRLFADILRRPAFETEKVEVLRGQILEAIRRRNDNPREIAPREFRRLLYGKAHPLGRIPTPESVQAITRDDLVSFHRKTVTPARITLAISGDLTRKEAVAKLEKVFRDWKGGKDEAFAIPAPAPLDPGVYQVKKEVNQTSIRVGHVGILHEDPDFFPLTVLNTAFGGVGFSSRLWKEIRSNRGLAYSAGSGLNAGAFAPGLFTVSSETKSGTTIQAIETIRDMIRALTEKPLSGEELRMAKDILLNAYVFNFQSSAAVVRQRATFEYYGYPPDYLETYPDRVRAVTLEQTFEAAKRHLHPDELRIFTVGDPSKFEKPLSTFGPVTEIPLETSDGPARAPGTNVPGMSAPGSSVPGTHR